MNRLLVILLGLAAAVCVVSAKKPTLTKCEVCQDIVTAAELFVKFKGWNATTLLAGADKICSVLGGFSEECSAIINAGGLPFADCITSGGNTTECCTDIPVVNFCSSRAVKKSNRISVNKPKMTECAICQDFVQVAEMFVKFEGWNASTIVAEADKLCGFLGQYATECKTIISAGGLPFATCITSGTSNATQCCQAIPLVHVCSSKSPSARLTVVKPEISECAVCQDFVQVAEMFVKFEGWNASTIITEADKLCGFLGQYAAECKTIIDAGGMAFATCITSGTSNATQCCQAIPVIKVCSSEQPELRLESQPFSFPAVKATPCVICTDLVMVAELFVKFEGWNATDILNEADKLCSILGSLAAECKAIINAGGMNFTTCIATGGSGQQCCAAIPAIHVCSSTPALAVRPKADPTLCQVCQDVVMIAELFVKFEGWNASTLLAEADKICSVLGSLSTPCKSLINAGGMAFATCITTGGNTTACCTDIPGLHVCTAAVAPKPKLTECQVCQDFVELAELFVKYENWNASTILAEADKLCGYLPATYAATCKAIVQVGGMAFATCITTNNNATQCCQSIPELHICSTSVARLELVKPKLTECQVCQDFVMVAELFVKYENWNATDILNEADKLCGYLPATYAATCKAIVQVGGLAFATCITTNNNATQCCAAIPELHICSSLPVVPKPELTTCAICQDFVEVAELFVKFEGWNSTDILDQANKLCSLIPGFSKECQAIVDAGGLPLAECIAANTNTTQCCLDIPALHVCATLSPSPVPLAAATKKQPIRMKLN